MFCRNCGKKIATDSVFCCYCGVATDSPDQERQISAAADYKEAAATEKDKSPEATMAVSMPPDHKDGIEAAENNFSYMTLPPEEKRPPQVKPKKPRLGLAFGIAGGITLFFLLLSLFITATALSKDNTPFYDHLTDFSTESSNDIGNTPANSLCFGIATMQDDTIYYLNEAIDIDQDKIKAVDLNGNNEQVFFTFDGEISDINVIGDQLFFVGDTYDTDYNLMDSGIYVYDLYNETLEEIYVAEDSIYHLYVHSDQIYFDVSTENGGDQILKADLDGLDVQTVLAKQDYIYSFAVFDDFIYYIYQETLYRCDFNGQHETEIYTSPNIIDTYCVTDNAIYIADHPETDRLVIKRLNLDGSGEEELVFLSKYAEVWYLNVAADNIYYIEVTTDDDGETVSSKLCSLHTDGTGKQTILSSKESYFGLALCGSWLFSYDNNKMKTVKINVNDTAKNSI